MEDPKPGVSRELVALPPCASSNHPASEHSTPNTKCRMCGDDYTDPADDDQPSDVLLGE